MIEKDKTYSYDEIKKIFNEAEKLALEKVESSTKEASNGNATFIATQTLLAILNYGILFNKLFSNKEKEN